MMARILVIDDTMEMRGLLHALFIRKGHEVFLADGGERGVALFLEARPMITILDIKMGGLDGLQVLEKIRSADLRAPVILLSGYCSQENEARALALGAAYVLSKGPSLAGLLEAVKHLVVGRSAMPSLAT